MTLFRIFICIDEFQNFANPNTVNKTFFSCEFFNLGRFQSLPIVAILFYISLAKNENLASQIC